MVLLESDIDLSDHRKKPLPMYFIQNNLAKARQNSFPSGNNVKLQITTKKSICVALHCQVCTAPGKYLTQDKRLTAGKAVSSPFAARTPASTSPNPIRTILLLPWSARSYNVLSNLNILQLWHSKRFMWGHMSTENNQAGELASQTDEHFASKLTSSFSWQNLLHYTYLFNTWR
jgi:hypothetical protein